MKKSAKEATVEELITDVSNCEDPDQILQIFHDGNGLITVTDPEWKTTGEGPTLKDALLAYGKLYWSSYPEDTEFDYE